MGTVLHPSRPPVLRSRRPTAVIVVASMLAAVAVWVLAERLVSSAPFVDRVTIINPTPHELQVEVSTSGGGTGVDLGAVAREETKTFEDVLDQGDEWIVRFRSAHLAGGEVRVAKADLARGDWKVTVPSAVWDRLAAEGATPSAGR
jgi:hypothetical protein